MPVGPLVTLKPGMVFGVPNGGARHGQNSDLDAHVTLMFLGPGIRSGRYRRRVGTTDIAPTLAHLIGVSPGADVTGRVLREALLDER